MFNLPSIGSVFVLGAVSFGLGGLPVIDWLVQGLTQQRLSDLGTGNISVSAAFYHGGVRVGLLAVLSEALKGVAAVLLARYLFPGLPAWEIMALIALVLGRFSLSRGAGTTNVVWGYVVHDWGVALLVLVGSGLLFGVVRRRQQARLGVLMLIPIAEALRRPDSPGAIAAATVLSLLMALIYQQIPDDLALSPAAPSTRSRKMFQVLRGRDVIGSLADQPNVPQMGHKAATLAQLKQAGYPVPPGWILPVGSEPRSLIRHLENVVPDPWGQPWIVRSSALDEDQEATSAAGQYLSVGNVTSPAAMEQAIADCRAAYYREGAQRYRRDRGLAEQPGLALLVQRQVTSVYAGVAFSRDPVDQGSEVVVETLAGQTDQVVSGQVTPEAYRLQVNDEDLAALPPEQLAHLDSPLPTETADTVPQAIVQRAAALARHLELHYHGIPQDIEWGFDGKQLWLLQSRPITTLTPIWTRKIAAEVIPGVIRPLTWSINRPLTCGVWGQIFTIVLGPRAAGLDFGATATLHYARAYFNATLLGQIFRRMGLPPESLEFLTLGAKFSKPPIFRTLRNGPGLLRLWRRERSLRRDFERDQEQCFGPLGAQLQQQPLAALTAPALLDRVDRILQALERATYYSILAPLSFALRRAVLQVPESQLDQSQLPEVASVQAVNNLAQVARQQFPEGLTVCATAGDRRSQALCQYLEVQPDGQPLLAELEQILDRYGYLSEVGTDIAVPTWREDPQPVRELFAQFFCQPPAGDPPTPDASGGSDHSRANWRVAIVQHRLHLKGQVAQVYLTLLAELRWSLLALEQRAIAHGLLQQPGDAFFLTNEELRQWLAQPEAAPPDAMQALVAQRRSQYQAHQDQTTVPFIVYGNEPPPTPTAAAAPQPGDSAFWQGIGASPGEVVGRVKVLHSLQAATSIPPQTILVVPYTDAGWAPILAQAAGLVAEVGGRLSHGAIVAREYRIPAVMNIAHATTLFQDGQTLRLDGRTGTVELVEDRDRPTGTS